MTDDLERFQEYLLNTMEIAEWIRLQECFRSWYEMRRNCGIYDREFTGRVVFRDD